MDIFTYISSNDEYGAKAICNKHGFDVVGVQTAEDMGECLRQLVAEVGEPAMRDIVLLHPDRDIILEVSGGDGTEKKECSCSKNKKSNAVEMLLAQSGTNNSTLQQGHVFIIAAALLLAVAIVAK